jgi:hypothetical protein
MDSLFYIACFVFKSMPYPVSCGCVTLAAAIEIQSGGFNQEYAKEILIIGAG